MTWALALPLSGGFGAAVGSGFEAGIFGLAFLFGGLMFGPDLDVPSVQVRRWGALRWIWGPYQKLFRHRSPWTHGLLLGPLVRVVYLGIWLLGGMALVSGFLGTGEGALSLGLKAGSLLEPRFMWAAGAGVTAGSALHSMADEVVSRGKRLFRRRRARR